MEIIESLFEEDREPLQDETAFLDEVREAVCRLHPGVQSGPAHDLLLKVSARRWHPSRLTEAEIRADERAKERERIAALLSNAVFQRGVTDRLRLTWRRGDVLSEAARMLLAPRPETEGDQG